MLSYLEFLRPVDLSFDLKLTSFGFRQKTIIGNSTLQQNNFVLLLCSQQEVWHLQMEVM